MVDCDGKKRGGNEGYAGGDGAPEGARGRDGDGVARNERRASGTSDGAGGDGGGKVADDRRVRSQKLAPPTLDEISEVVDAVTGATWGERNRIMEARFAARLSEAPDDVPAFSPPGTPLSDSAGSCDAGR